MAFGDLIPLVGATLAAILIGVVTLFNDFPADTIIWAIFALGYQQFENYVIQPQIQKRAVELEPFVILVSVLFGGTLFGIAGALLAIPIGGDGPDLDPGMVELPRRTRSRARPATRTAAAR